MSPAIATINYILNELIMSLVVWTSSKLPECPDITSIFISFLFLERPPLLHLSLVQFQGHYLKCSLATSSLMVYICDKTAPPITSKQMQCEGSPLLATSCEESTDWLLVLPHGLTHTMTHRVSSTTLILKFECAYMSPGTMVKCGFKTCRSLRGPGFCISHKLPGVAYAALNPWSLMF